MATKIINGDYESFVFPGGEVQVKVTALYGVPYADVEADLSNSEEVMRLLLLCDAIKRMGRKIRNLVVPYFPYARQDRVCNVGEALSVKVMADLINSIGAEAVIITDPHSDVTPALINNVVVHNLSYLFPYKKANGKTIICPDAGAEKKIVKLGLPYILCTKKRDTTTGEITGTIVHHHGSLEGKDVIIVDDICDGGRTFIEIAKVLRTKNAGKVSLYVTHGIFSKGFDVFTGLIDEIFYYKEGELRHVIPATEINFPI